jgi:Uma2 family endonuclease
MIRKGGNLAMSVALRITFDEYMAMIADGAFDALRDRRIELINGELREMTPPGPDHSGAIDWITEWSVLSPPRGHVTVRVQNPISIPEADSAPQPDVVWAIRRDYRDRNPLPEEVLLLIEVADSSLAFDCGEKADLYAAAGIADYWVVDLQHRLVRIFREAKPSGYGEQREVKFGDAISPLAFPGVRLNLSELFTSGRQ